MHKISELNNASGTYSGSERSASPTPTESQAESPGMGQEAHFPASRSAQAPEPQKVGAMPSLPPRHRCSRYGCTTARMNVDALKRTRRPRPPSTRDSRARVLLSTGQNYLLAVLD